MTFEPRIKKLRQNQCRVLLLCQVSSHCNQRLTFYCANIHIHTHTQRQSDRNIGAAVSSIVDADNYYHTVSLAVGLQLIRHFCRCQLSTSVISPNQSKEHAGIKSQLKHNLRRLSHDYCICVCYIQLAKTMVRNLSTMWLHTIRFFLIFFMKYVASSPGCALSGAALGQHCYNTLMIVELEFVSPFSEYALCRVPTDIDKKVSFKDRARRFQERRTTTRV